MSNDRTTSYDRTNNRQHKSTSTFEFTAWQAQRARQQQQPQQVQTEHREPQWKLEAEQRPDQ